MNQLALDEVAKAPETPDPWIDSGYYPRLRGPHPSVVGPTALVLANGALALFPGGFTFLAINAALLALTLTVCFAYQAPQEPVMDRVHVLALFALATLWTVAVHIIGDRFDALWQHALATANALLLWLAYHLKALRHSWWITVHVSDYWDPAGLVRYGRFLASNRPGPGSARVARELYRVACAEYLKNGGHSDEASEAMLAYANLLAKGRGGWFDRRKAEWWRDQAGQGRSAPVAAAPARA